MAALVLQEGYDSDHSGSQSASRQVILNGVTAGSTLIAHLGFGGAYDVSVSDGTAYTPASDKIGPDANGQNDRIFILENAAAGTHTVVAAFTEPGGAQYTSMKVYEVSGLLSSGALDKIASQMQSAPGTGTDAISSGATATTTQADEFVMGFTQDTLNVDPGAGTISAGTGYTKIGTNNILAAEYKTVSSVGAQTATFTHNSAAQHITQVLTFKIAGGGGAAPTISDSGDEAHRVGEKGVSITGTGFGASQGAGQVIISPTDNVNDSNAVVQTVETWADTAITFTVVASVNLPRNSTLYLFVKENGGLSNSSGYVIQILPNGRPSGNDGGMIDLTGGMS